MNSKTPYLISAAVLIVIVGVGIYFVQTHKVSEQSPVTTATTTPIGPVTLSLGSKSVMVSAVQRALIKEGYMQGQPTGVYDTSTEAAVEAFQKAKGLTVTGMITIASSAVTSSFKNSAPAFVTVDPSSSPAEISSVQAYFIKIGYLKIATSTGVYGPATEAAVKAFEKAHGIPQTGVIDMATFAAMNGG